MMRALRIPGTDPRHFRVPPGTFRESETTTLIPAMGYSRAMASVACNIKSASPTVHRCYREGQVT